MISNQASLRYLTQSSCGFVSPRPAPAPEVAGLAEHPPLDGATRQRPLSRARLRLGSFHALIAAADRWRPPAQLHCRCRPGRRRRRRPPAPAAFSATASGRRLSRPSVCERAKSPSSLWSAARALLRRRARNRRRRRLAAAAQVRRRNRRYRMTLFRESVKSRGRGAGDKVALGCPRTPQRLSSCTDTTCRASMPCFWLADDPSRTRRRRSGV
jgi:hypothetical protein